MKKKGQAAMEFLMTYGWAILVVLAAIAALAYFGVLSPQNLLPERTTFTAPLPNVDTALVTADGVVEVAFRNNVGVSIRINASEAGSAVANDNCGAVPAITVTYDETTYTTTTATIPNGAGFLLSWACTAGNAGEKFKATIGFDYINAETGQVRKHTGTVDGKYQ